MEKKKNNAVEKVDNAVENKITEKKVKNKKPAVKKSKQAKLKERAMKEKIRAEKRIELARIKAHKKAEKEKARAAVLREKNRKKMELKARKEQLKTQKQERKQMLKNETKKERELRLKEERAEKLRIKENIRKEKAERKKARRERRQKNREQGRSYGGWLAAVISLGVATLVLASVLTFTFMMPEASDIATESNYRKSFYDTVEQVDNIDTNLSKAIATKDKGAMQLYLVDVAINSELAENDLQQLPLKDENKYYTTKLVNQIGDYAKYLNKKIVAGENLSQEDIDGLIRLYNANLTFKNALAKMVDGMSPDYSFGSMADGGNGNLIIENFNELQNLSVEYPELIYDGPFSDGLDRKEIKGLSGEEIDEITAKEIFVSVFSDYALENVENVGASSGNVESFNVQAVVNGEVLFAQVSKIGGKVLMFSYAGSCNAENIGEEQAIKKAEDFLAKNGFENMKPVWVNFANNLYTLNFAYEDNGIIVYSDLVKVRVCAETSAVIGMEAINYYTNHTERNIATPKLSEEAAAKKVSDNIKIQTGRLAVVPIGNNTEKLCYEFSGNYDGTTYYVYIDVITGRQVEMFKTVKSTEGELLM